MYVCLCKSITDKQLLEALDAGAKDLGELEDSLGVGTNCGGCRDFAQQLVDENRAERLGYSAT